MLLSIVPDVSCRLVGMIPCQFLQSFIKYEQTDLQLINNNSSSLDSPIERYVFTT